MVVDLATASDRFSRVADEDMITRTVAALERRGLSVEIVDTLDQARDAVLARLPEGAEVMTFTSATVEESGVAAAVNESGRYVSVRRRLMALDYATQRAEMKRLVGGPEYAVGSVQALTAAGEAVSASASGSQLGAYAYGAANVIWMVGAQKLVADEAEAIRRIHDHCLPLEDRRVRAAFGGHSYVGKILTMHGEEPGRIHIVLIRRHVGY